MNSKLVTENAKIDIPATRPGLVPGKTRKKISRNGGEPRMAVREPQPFLRDSRISISQFRLPNFGLLSFQFPNSSLRIAVFVLLSMLLSTAPLAAQFWEFGMDLPLARSGLSAVAVDDTIYVLGGRDENGSILARVDKYEPESAVWQTGLPPLLQAREHAAAVVRNDTIFVLGGRDTSDTILATVEWWRPGEASWQPFAPLNQNREGLAGVVLAGRIYAIGGFGEVGGSEAFLTNVEVFNPEVDRWQFVGNWQLQQGVTLLAAVAVADTAITIGGFSAVSPVNFVDQYSPQSGVAPRPDLQQARGGHAAVARHDTLIVFGGRSASDRLLFEAEIYTPAAGDWHSEQGPNEEREEFAAAVVQGRIFVFGGLGSRGETLASVESIKEFGGVTSVQDDDSIPGSFSLAQNYPNPFNATTTITFRMQNRMPVTLAIHNLQGQLVRTLLRNTLAPGEHKVTWDGRDRSGAEASSGLFIYTLRAGEQVISKKLILLR